MFSRQPLSLSLVSSFKCYPETTKPSVHYCKQILHINNKRMDQAGKSSPCSHQLYLFSLLQERRVIKAANKYTVLYTTFPQAVRGNGVFVP